MATKIEWANETWNPITGCTPISEGCQNCYAQRMSKRLAGRCGYPKDEPFRVTLHPDRLDQPLRWKKSRRIFVCSMGDLFHPDVQDWMLDEIFGVILGCKIFNNTPDHIFMVLTKRPERMLNYFTSRNPVELLKAWSNACPWHANDPDVTVEDIVYGATCRDWDEQGRNSSGSEHKPWGYIDKLWPLPNLWLGVTAENQARADERIPVLLQTPSAVRFVSVEPCLSDINLGPYLWDYYDQGSRRPLNKLHQVICGGETGPGARPMHPDWVRSLRDQCKAAVPFFFKSWGDYCFVEQMSRDTYAMVDKANNLAGHGDYEKPWKVGKKRAGRLLDGREWNEYPEAGI